MAVDFPGSPTSGQVFSVGGASWRYNGYAWARIPDPGEKGQKGQKGDKGEKGQKGIQGDKGVQGNFGGATFDYTFSDATGTPTDLNTGRLRLNNSTVSSATTIFIDDEDDNGTDIQPFLRTIDDSTSTIKGHVRISNKLNADDFALFTISSATEQSGFHQISVGYVSGSASSFTNGEDIIVTFARTGDQGQKGEQGIQGVPGVQDKIFEGDTEAEVVDTGSNGHFKVTTEGDERLRITSGGSVNIGGDYTQTTRKFKVTGNSTFDGGIVFTGTLEGSGFAVNGGNVIMPAYISHDGDPDTKFGFPANDTIAFETAGDERLRIDSSGNVGINQNNPSAFGKFVVNGTGNVMSLRASSGAGSLAFFEGGTGRFYIKTLNGSDGLSFVDGDNTSERLRIDSSGRLLVGGTGNTESDIRLYLHNPSAAGSQIQITGNGSGTGNNDGLRIGYNGSGGQMWLFENEYLRFATNNKERLRITSAGFVQIGDTADAAEAPLHVTAENSQGINAIFGAKDFIDSSGYNYDDANIALQGRDADDNDTGAGIQFTVRNTGDSDWLHGAITLDQSGAYVFKNGGAGSTAGTEKFRFGSSGQLGLAGANYGTSGQVLTSQGGSSSPQWVTPIANTNTTYDLITSSSGSNVNLKLDASGAADDDTILITAGSNVSFSSVSATGFTINTVDNNTTYTLDVPTGTSNPQVVLNGSDSSSDGIELVPGTNMTITRVNGGAISFSSTDTNTNTTYDLITSSSGSNVILTLDASGGADDDPVTITAGSNITLTENGSGTGFTIASTDTNTQTIINNNADNRIITGSNTANTLNAESTLTYDGSVFKINGTGQALLTLRTTSNTSDRGIAFQNSGNAYVASINVEDAGSDSGDLVFHVDDSNNSDLSLVEERLRIKTSGALGLNGSNYGASGQVLTSQGSNSAPTWSTLPSGVTTFLQLNDTPSSFTANKTLKVNSSGNAIIFADDINTNTTYDLVTSTSGSNIKLKLDASTGSGDDDEITITAGTNVTLTDNSGGGFTINTSATLTGTIDNANNVLINTASGDEYKNITFVDRDVTDDSYDRLRIDTQDDRLAYNPSANKLRTINLRVTRIYTSGDSSGSSGQLLTSGGTGAFTWTNASSVGTDNYANTLSFSSGTLTLGRTGSLSNLTASIPLSGITGDFTDLDDTPNDYNGDANKLVAVNNGNGTNGTGLTFVTASSVGTDNYANSLSFSSGTLTLGRTGSLSNLTVSIPLSGITGDFTDLDDTPGSYSGHANKVLTVNSNANGVTFTTASSVGQTYTAGSDFGMTLNGTEFRLKNDRRRNSNSVDIYSGNTHDYTFYDASVGIRWYTAGSEEMRLENDGDLHVDRDIIAYSTTVPSDIRLKKDLQIIQNPLDIINKINGYTFTYKKDDKKSAGVVAQEVEKVFPQAVSDKNLPFSSKDRENPDNYKIVAYDQIVGLLVQAVKELTDKVKKLESR